MKVIVFDLGGTLMEYVGMPYSWADFYHKGFEAIIRKYNCSIPEEALIKSLQMLKEFNPRINYREVEYSAEHIFSTIMKHWHIDIPVQNCIETFWSGLNLNVEFYPETMDVLRKLKEDGYAVAALTDLPNAMPDEYFKRDIAEIFNYMDCYISSSIAGYRKPHIKGLQMISDRFNVPISELLFVGDEEKDRKTAFNANCSFIQIQRTGRNLNSIGNLYELFQFLE